VGADRRIESLSTAVCCFCLAWSFPFLSLLFLPLSPSHGSAGRRSLDSAPRIAWRLGIGAERALFLCFARSPSSASLSQLDAASSTSIENPQIHLPWILRPSRPGTVIDDDCSLHCASLLQSLDSNPIALLHWPALSHHHPCSLLVLLSLSQKCQLVFYSPRSQSFLWFSPQSTAVLSLPNMENRS
jgi:hypothetical protein